MSDDASARQRQALNSLERSVIELLLDHDEPGFHELRAQFRDAHVINREMTGVGFFASLDPNPDAPASSYPKRLVDGVAAEIDGLEHGAAFILWLDSGRIDTLEGFCYGEEHWPEEDAAFRVYREWVAGTHSDPEA